MRGLHLGGAGVATSADGVLEGNPTDAKLNMIGRAGDVNGDGFEDVVSDFDKATPRGRVRLFPGGVAGVSPTSAIHAHRWTERAMRGRGQTFDVSLYRTERVESWTTDGLTRVG